MQAFKDGGVYRIYVHPDDDVRVPAELETDVDSTADRSPGYPLGPVFTMQAEASLECGMFSNRYAGIESLYGDTAATNLKRLEALNKMVSFAMHALPELHDEEDVRDLPTSAETKRHLSAVLAEESQELAR